MKRYCRRQTCSHTSSRRSPKMVTLNMILGLSSVDGGMTVGLSSLRLDCRHLTVVGLHDTGPWGRTTYCRLLSPLRTSPPPPPRLLPQSANEEDNAPEKLDTKRFFYWVVNLILHPLPPPSPLQTYSAQIDGKRIGREEVVDFSHHFDLN